MRLRAALLLTLIALPTVASAQTRSRRESPAPRAASGPPHAWLFGTWTGGLFPVLPSMAQQDCRTQPTVAFSQDVVAHAELTGAAAIRRVIETVRTTPQGAEFRFSPMPSDKAGFGCEDPNVLHVLRAQDGTVSFPGCAAFPYPLQHCTAS